MHQVKLFQQAEPNTLARQLPRTYPILLNHLCDASLIRNLQFLFVRKDSLQFFRQLQKNT